MPLAGPADHPRPAIANLLQIPNTESNGLYVDACKAIGVERHPARFPAKLPEFFIRLLTEPGDVVVDVFAGSNTTGQVAEGEGRRWLSFELRGDYVASSAFRFLDKRNTRSDLQTTHDSVLAGKTVRLSDYAPQPDLLAQVTRPVSPAAPGPQSSAPPPPLVPA